MSTHRSQDHHPLRHLGLGAIVAITLGLTAACQQDPQVRASPSPATQAATASMPTATASPAGSGSPASSAPAPSSATNSTNQPATPPPPSTAPAAPSASTSSSPKQPVGSPAATGSATTIGPVTAANLPPANLIFGGEWESETSAGWGERLGGCDLAPLKNAQHVLRRSFPSPGGESPAATAYVMDFPDSATGASAVDSLGVAYAKCAKDGGDTYQTESADLKDSAHQASPVGPVYANALRLLPTNPETGAAVNVLVIQVGARVMWIEMVDFGGADCAVTTYDSAEPCTIYANATDLALRLMAT